MSVIKTASRGIYRKTRSRYRNNGKYTLNNRSHNSDTLCIVLAGYKSFLWKDTLGRLKQFFPEEWDVCVLSSGKYSAQLDEISKANDWSYLYTRRNNLSLIQNIAIGEFEHAKYIFKMDEDIFATDEVFNKMKNGLLAEEQDGEFNPGFVAPVINVNNFSYLSLLRRFQVEPEFSEKVLKGEKARRGRFPFNSLPGAAEFMWGIDGQFPNIDQVALQLAKEPLDNEICSTRFNIGLILFRREIWEKIHGFKVGFSNAMGLDEEQIDTYCMIEDCPPVIVGDAFAGHFGFGGAQGKHMAKIYNEKPEFFAMK